MNLARKGSTLTLTLTDEEAALIPDNDAVPLMVQGYIDGLCAHFRQRQAEGIMGLPFDDPALLAAKARVDTLAAQAAVIPE